MIVAGEASGDAHAAALVRALRAAAPEIQFEFFGSTGAQMRAAGVDSVVRRDDLAILGLWEIGRALPKFWGAFGELKRAAAAQDLSLVDTSRLRAASESRGVDPYNTSGSFDRKRNWTRVGKR